jgi:hypothetical protein
MEDTEGGLANLFQRDHPWSARAPLSLFVEGITSLRVNDIPKPVIKWLVYALKDYRPSHTLPLSCPLLFLQSGGFLSERLQWNPGRLGPARSV